MENLNNKTEKMKTARLKDLNRKQLEKLLKVNHPEVGFNKRTTVQNLRLKFNMLGDEFANITFNKNWFIKNNSW
tara:strand:+ start:216 stop:437 length:222 start_codon:yes stop_codon:yes gene_type:complete